jgi:hypothetical protein
MVRKEKLMNSYKLLADYANDSNSTAGPTPGPSSLPPTYHLYLEIHLQWKP